LRGVAGWVFQRVTGAVLLCGLAVHFYVMHFLGPENIAYEAVARRLESPFWMAFNAVFLASAIYHGFNGLWGMAVEYVPGGRPLRAAKSVLLGAASGLLVVGLYILAL
jgi:succinate dehydrogenase / fumarate reductase membrane anchor subunit